MYFQQQSRKRSGYIRSNKDSRNKQLLQNYTRDNQNLPTSIRHYNFLDQDQNIYQQYEPQQNKYKPREYDGFDCQEFSKFSNLCQQEEFSQYNFDGHSDQEDQSRGKLKNKYVNYSDYFQKLKKDASQNKFSSYQEPQSPYQQPQAAIESNYFDYNSNFWEMKLSEIKNKKIQKDRKIKKGIQQQADNLRLMQQRKKNLYRECGMQYKQQIPQIKQNLKLRHRLIQNYPKRYNNQDYNRQSETFIRMNSIGSSDFSSFRGNQQKGNQEQYEQERIEEESFQQFSKSQQEQCQFSPLAKDLPYLQYQNGYKVRDRNNQIPIKISEILQNKQNQNVFQIQPHSKHIQKLNPQYQEQESEELIIQYNTKQFSQTKPQHNVRQQPIPKKNKALQKFPSFNKNQLSNRKVKKFDDNQILTSGDRIKFDQKLEQSAQFQLSLEDQPVKKAQAFQVQLNRQKQSAPITLADAFKMRCGRLANRLQNQRHQFTSKYKPKPPRSIPKKLLSNNSASHLNSGHKNQQLHRVKSTNQRQYINSRQRNNSNYNKSSSRQKNTGNNPFTRNSHITVEIKVPKSKPPLYNAALKKEGPSDQIMDRLAQGIKQQVNPKQMKQLTSKNYQRLPEVKKRKQQARKKEQLRQRIAKQKQFDRCNRTKMRIKLRYG